MAKTIKSRDLNGRVAAILFCMLNEGKVTFKEKPFLFSRLITDVSPKDLTYPEGWYYAKGCFRNKHQSSTGLYDEIIMMTSSGEFWHDYAKYCTLDD